LTISITFCVSFILGFLVKKILKSKWHALTFASIFIIIICSTFYISQYKPAYEIIVPGNYVGEVKLFVSNEKGNDFAINKYGIGYIDRETFEKGFYPKIIKGNIDITKQAKEYSKGAFAATQASDYSSSEMPKQVKHIHIKHQSPAEPGFGDYWMEP
jgi:energy-coupling factor transporter transmembrane protein EcfT